MNEKEYILKWIDKSVTLLEWSEMRFKLIDHWEILNQLNLDNEDLTEIFYHQFALFEQCVNNVVNGKIESLSHYSLSDRAVLITERLRLIDLFLNSIDINPVLTRLLSRSVYTFNTEDYLNILESVQRVMNKVVDPDTPNNYDINRTNNRSPFDYSRSYFIASFILKYQSELNRILNEKSIDEKPQKNNGYTNQLTTYQKNVVDELVNDGHKESHIFRLLKESYFFTLSELQFKDYLNQFHARNLDINKRFTASKNLNYTKEIENKFGELQIKYREKSQ